MKNAGEHPRPPGQNHGATRHKYVFHSYGRAAPAHTTGRPAHTATGTRYNARRPFASIAHPQVAMPPTTLPAIPFQRCEQVIRPLRQDLFRPTAPALKDPRYADHAIPDHVLPLAKGRTAVFPTPDGGHLLYLPKKKRPQQHDLGYLAPGATKVDKLDAGQSWWPFPHAWSPDGAQLFVCARNELFGIRFPQRDARRIDHRQPGQRFDAISTSTGLYAVVDDDHLTVRTLDDDHIILQHPASGGCVAFLGDRFLLTSTQNQSALYAVDGTHLTPVAHARVAVMHCWEEDGHFYANLSTDDLSGNIDSKELVHTYRVGEVEGLWVGADEDRA